MKLLLVQPVLSFEPGADNLDTVTRLLEPHRGALGTDDIVLLPEHFDLRPSRAAYESGIQALAVRLGCHVVGGSHHEDRAGAMVNSGVVANATGEVVGRYEKLRPYAEERARVGEGHALGEVRIGGRAILVLICADFWFSDLFYKASVLPDLVLVPALSVTRKPTPDYSRALWKHLAVARAYEFGAYVGISDWAHVPSPGPSPSGVAGFADPTTVDPSAMFSAIDGPVHIHDVSFEPLEALRRDRMGRGFFWKRPETLG